MCVISFMVWVIFLYVDTVFGFYGYSRGADLMTHLYLTIFVWKSASSMPIFLTIRTQSIQKVRKWQHERVRVRCQRS